jgi:DNA-binding NtrC family response regulator
VPLQHRAARPRAATRRARAPFVTATVFPFRPCAEREESSSSVVLVVDDEPGIRLAVRHYLNVQGLDVVESETCEQALAAYREQHFDAAIVDYNLIDGNAIDLLVKFHELDADLPVVVLTGFGTIELAVQALQKGAANFLTKPVELSALYLMVQRLIDGQRDRRHLYARQTGETRRQFDPFVGTSAAIQRLYEQAVRACDTEAPILLQGETGTGKGVLVRWLHSHGSRAAEALVDLNCASLAGDLVTSELFGHEKGAFTGAVNRKPGVIGLAHHGTLFLDEIGDLEPTVQPKLLKVLEEKTYRALGDVRERRVDMRLVAATHRDLRELIGEGRFRQDLYYRISAIQLVIPPLRERPVDIPPIAQVLIGRMSRRLDRKPIQLSTEAEASLCTHHWPGNIRELRNVLERAAVLADSGVIEAKNLHFDTGIGPRHVESHLELLSDVESRHIERVLAQERGDVTRAARRLGISRSTLYQRLKDGRVDNGER